MCVGRNFIHDDGATEIATSLMKNNSLLKLGLANNCIGPRGVRALCDCMLRNKRLCDLDLNRNPLSASGAEVAPLVARVRVHLLS